MYRPVWSRITIKYLSTHPCVDCGETDFRVLDFDHVSDKKLANVSNMVWKPSPLATIKKEIAKCEVRCANDHRRVTYDRKQVTGYEEDGNPPALGAG